MLMKGSSECFRNYLAFKMIFTSVINALQGLATTAFTKKCGITSENIKARFEKLSKNPLGKKTEEQGQKQGVIGCT